MAEWLRAAVRDRCAPHRGTPGFECDWCVAAGFVVGMLIPSTRVENRRLGSAADTVKEHARAAGSQAAEHAKQVAQDVAETAKKAGQQHADELRESITSTSS